MIALAFLFLQSAASPAPVPNVALPSSADATPVTSTQAGSSSPAPEKVTEPQVEPWDRPFREGLIELRQRAESGATDEAVELADRLVATNAYARRVEDLVHGAGWRARLGRALESFGDRLDLMGPPPEVRAEAQYARGVALTIGAQRASEDGEREKRREDARVAFESARLLAGPGELRLDATYDQGLLAFQAGEEQRAKLPEISGQQVPPPTPPPAAAAPGAQQTEPPDPLKLARAAYLAARERFVERLRLDWHDADTQANVELVQRRLRELDEIEKKREEEKKKQQEQEKKDDQDKKDSSKDPNQDKQKDDSKDQQKPDEPKPQDPAQDPKKDDPKQDEKKADEPKPADESKDKEDASKPQPVDPQDQPKMSKEEKLQLLERLQKIDDIQQELQERLKRMRKVSVEKDW